MSEEKKALKEFLHTLPLNEIYHKISVYNDLIDKYKKNGNTKFYDKERTNLATAREVMKEMVV